MSDYFITIHAYLNMSLQILLLGGVRKEVKNKTERR